MTTEATTETKVCDTCQEDCSSFFSESFQEQDGELKLVETLCGGCADRRTVDDYAATKVITSRMLMLAALDSEGLLRFEFLKNSFKGLSTEEALEQAFLVGQHLVRASESTNTITKAVSMFEEAVWFGGLDPVAEDLTEPYPSLGLPYRKYKEDTKPPEGSLQRFICGECVSGHSTTFENEQGEPVKLLSLAMCGRWRMTIESKGAFIDVITEEDSPSKRMGINGISATEEAAMKLLTDTITAWKAGVISFAKDGEVHILGAR